MLKVLGTKDCPDCIELKKNFDYYNIQYEFFNIQETTKNLKSFMVMRDTDDFYKKAREKGLIGIPTLVFEDGTKSFYWKKYLEDLGFEPLPDEGKSCNINSKHC